MALQRARAWLYDVFVHHHAERLKTNRAVERKALGVGVEDLPYPGAVSGSGNTINNAGGFLKGAILSALLLATGGAAGLALGILTPGTATPPAAPVDRAAPDPAAGPRSYEAIYEQQQPDGTWKEIKREPLK